MKAYISTFNLGNLRICDVIPFYEEYNIESVEYKRIDARSGYLRIKTIGMLPDNTHYAATRVFTTKTCVMLARKIRNTNQHHIDCGICDCHEIQFVNFGKLLD